MGLWQRFTTLFRVKASSVMDRAENPTETLDYSYQRQLEIAQIGVGRVALLEQLQPLAVALAQHLLRLAPVRRQERPRHQQHGHDHDGRHGGGLECRAHASLASAVA